jgi:DNA-directed RNA polymerase specialized sigma24 family protein
MSDQADVRVLTLAGIAHRCAQETELFFQGQGNDPRYCFELFYRAIVDRDQRAWELVYAQYRPLVAGWVRRHPGFPASGEQAQYFVNRAFEKMWIALSPDRFGQFSDLKSVLRYLQMCVHSVILDQVRVAGPNTVDVQALEVGESSPVVEKQALARVHREEFWQEINQRLRSDKERWVVYGSFMLGLKPRELFAQFGEKGFRDVNEIYRVKENVLARLSRDTQLRKFLGEDA